MTGVTDWVAVIPGKGQAAEVARVLLGLTDDPTHVRTDGNGSEFLVAPYVADRYNTASAPSPRPRRRAKKEDD
jgi:hypothetical protein